MVGFLGEGGGVAEGTYGTLKVLGDTRWPTAGSWHTCRQKQQLAKARAGDLGTSPEGEKLHSDSGVFLDTHSLQEPHQPGKGEHPPPSHGGGGGGGRVEGVHPS